MTNEGQTFHEIEGGVTAAKGFLAGGVYCGIRKIKKDIALITSSVPANLGAVFTLNKTVAAPVMVDRLQLKKGKQCSAIIVNSGNANACTGERGLNDAWSMIQATAESLGIPEEQVQVASTGIIGQYMPMPNVLAGIRALPAALSATGSLDAAIAIMTTDTGSKEVAVEFLIGDTPVKLGGIAKGSGMIAPNMATMLSFITTDAVIAQPLLQKTFGQKIDRSYNRISVDGDMSTNDMALILANGLAENSEILAETPEYALFCEALEYVLVKLAKMIARDGEGATKLVEVIVAGAATEKEALIAASSVANSNLVKTAIHGEDANWGRILAAIGYSGIDFDPDLVTLSMNEVPILGKAYDILLDEDLAKEAFKNDTITLSIDLGQGTASACFWTCDLSKEYVHINASYRS